MRLVEAVPNFSEGRNPTQIARIADAMAAVSEVALLHVDPERDTHRVVMTLMGAPEAVEEALFRGISEAVSCLDLREHAGSHPRMGAADVVPLVPWCGVSMSECVDIARRLGERLGRELGLPGWFYGAAAMRPENRYLHDSRRGQFEGLSRKMAQKEVDFGPQIPHPTAGATAVGARGVLVAMNCTLSTDDVRLAKDLARQIREFQHVRRASDGGVTQRQAVGMAGLRALGWYSQRDERAQVTMNLTNVQESPPHRVVQRLSQLCSLTNTEILGTELVGMIPESLLREAGHALDPADSDLVGAGIKNLRLGILHDFVPEERIVERVLVKHGLVG